jgi:hypothetical protein
MEPLRSNPLTTVVIPDEKKEEIREDLESIKVLPSGDKL